MKDFILSIINNCFLHCLVNSTSPVADKLEELVGYKYKVETVIINDVKIQFTCVSKEDESTKIGFIFNLNDNHYVNKIEFK